jgi:hypothetical protein
MKRYLGKILRYWMALGIQIGLVMTPVQMFLVYVLGFGVANVCTRVVGKDLLDRRVRGESSFWKSKETHPPSLENLRHTF